MSILPLDLSSHIEHTRASALKTTILIINSFKMKSAIAAVTLFAVGTFAAAMPAAEPTKVEAGSPTFVADAALATYSGVSTGHKSLVPRCAD